jgi:INO80 complex subunit C
MNSVEAKEAKEAEQAAHYALIEQLDIHSIHKTFRNPSWRPNQRRNKNIKAILGDASRREASMAITPMENGSGAVTPNNTEPAGNNNRGGGGGDDEKDDGLSTSGTSTPANDITPGGAGGPPASSQPNLAQASRSLSKLVLEKSLRPVAAGAGMTTGGLAAGGAGAPSATYTNIESAPSLAPQKRYCDVTGLPAPYQDPKTRLRYHDKEVFAMIRGLPQGYAEQYLEARGAHTVLK